MKKLIQYITVVGLPLLFVACGGGGSGGSSSTACTPNYSTYQTSGYLTPNSNCSTTSAVCQAGLVYTNGMCCTSTAPQQCTQPTSNIYGNSYGNGYNNYYGGGYAPVYNPYQYYNPYSNPYNNYGYGGGVSAWLNITL